MVDPDDAKTHQQRIDLPPAEELGSYALEAVEGADAGESWSLNPAAPMPILVGTSPVCTVKLEDRQVSRRHLGIELVDRQILVRDLGSTNGTRVDGVSITGAFLRAGQTIRLGSSALRLVRRETKTPTLLSHESFGRVRGSSLAMRRLYPVLARLAASNVPVVIEGETGTGKELVAEALHENGPRAQGPFVVLDCAGAPLDLAVFQQASGGTLVVENLPALDLATQAKLLRAVERDDVRVLVTTSVDLDAEVQAGRLREELYHRLAVSRVELPPLRNRREDIGVLARFFATALDPRGEALPEALLERWQNETWPGNVRELRNAVANRIALGDLAEPIAPAVARTESATMSLGTLVDDAVGTGMPLAVARQRVITMFEELYVEGILAKHDGHVLRAANAAGVARRYFQILKARLGK